MLRWIPSGATALVMVMLMLAGGSPDQAGAADGSAASNLGSATAAAGDPVSAAAGGIPTPAHVMIAVFENQNAGSILGNPAAPYLNTLARQGAVLTDSHGVAHPSEPNYLALFSGSTQGVTDDTCPVNLSGANLATELARAGRSFVGYSEDLPAAGWTGCDSGRYARRHNPWV